MTPTSEPADAEVAPGNRTLVELAEGADGWTLTVTIDDRVAQKIRATLADARATTLTVDGLTMSVEPNLVPGEPFEVETVTVRVERR